MMFSGSGMFLSPQMAPSAAGDDSLSYAEAFPPLPAAGGDDIMADSVLPSSPVKSGSAQWSKKMSLRSSTTTQVFSVPVEERRYKEMTEQHFGDRGREQAKICSEIMAKTGVKIEISLAKDQSLTVVISGKADAVLKARQLIVQHLQTQTHVSVKIPKEHHRFILGPKGKKLAELELATATKINVPRTNDASDVVTISGSRDGIDRARHELQLISDEQAKLAFERLSIPKIYHPFISGPDNQLVRELMDRTGAKIVIPPHSLERDEVVVSGEKDGVLDAKHYILAIYDEKKRKSTTVSVEVKKSQHRYVIGPKGAGLTEILAATGVSVEVPPSDNVSETITLRGDGDKLGAALTMANSIETRTIEAPSWLHRYIIGRQGANVRKITGDFPRVHIEFSDELNHIRVEGSPEDVQQSSVLLQELISDLTSRMAFMELNIDVKFLRHIVGRSGSNINRLKTDHGVDVRIPVENDGSNPVIVRIEGSRDGVASAKSELLQLVEKMENEKSRDVVIEQRLHRLIIGPHGSRIREIRDEFPTVSIFIPDYTRKSDIITLRGPRNDVDRCYTHLHQLCRDLMNAHVTAEVRVYRKYYQDVTATVRKVHEETDTKIHVPAAETNDVTVFTISGTKENVDKARDMLETTQKTLGRITELTLSIPHTQHAVLQGTRGALLRAVREECGGVLIRFPSAASSSDKVVIRGPADDVDRAKQLLYDLANDTNESRLTAELRIDAALHRYIIGRNGVNLRNLTDQSGAHIIFPSPSDADRDLVLIIGQRDAIDRAQKELESRVHKLETTTELEMSVDPRHHHHFLVRKADVVRQISEEFGGIVVTFPRLGVASDRVVLKGPKECVTGAQQRILDIISELESMVSVDCLIDSRYHRTVMGAKGCHIQDICHTHDVTVKFPERQRTDQGDGGGADVLVNGRDAECGDSANDTQRGRRQDVIVITGKPDACDAARKALMALVPITEELDVPVEHHRFIIGSKGRDVRQMMEEYDVNISVPSPRENSSLLRISGTPANVQRAKTGLLQRVEQLDHDKQQRAVRSFKLEVVVDPKFHPKIIGRRGAIVSKIRQRHDVQVLLPDKLSEHADVLVITGLEANVHAARDDILQIVHDLENLFVEEVELDHRIHSRIIGSRGRGINRISDEFHVDVKFPSRDAVNADLVVITGAADAVADCREHLLNLENEFLQDVADCESDVSATSPQPAARDSFSVRGAPWSNFTTAPDTSSIVDFPDLSAVGHASRHDPIVKWGPHQ